MKAWAKRLWLIALEDSKYSYAPQNGMLRRFESETKQITFDALGILCEATPRCAFHHAKNKGDEASYYYKNKNGPDTAPIKSSYIPDNLAAEMSLDYYAQFLIANMNDDGASKEEIKSWIRKNL